ncbi:MAG: UDP-N-acetylmuramoyl-L-alanyl-D-glutamate--2,6-diaminopimelate ligase [Ruminococcaceae bacterium]|nr:UDP-N-acetylmuramoyl-L-alanyl-D-glutamate--2,6-diaminopimelate ligase [Oscillospiraceae bacterium]
MKLKELLREAGLQGEISIRDGEMEITGISSHSKSTKRGELFVAVRGLNTDGYQYVGEAIARGAAFVISERKPEGVRCLQVEDARAALARLWDAWYGHPARSLSLIGVTGTNGKTSTATMICHILEKAGYKTGLIGTVECRVGECDLCEKKAYGTANMTTPDPKELYEMLACMRDAGAEFVVMEVSSHALALGRVEPLFFRCAVFTNLTAEHLDFHGDMEAYFAEKCKLFQKCEMAVVSHSTPYGARLCEGLECPFEELSPKTVSEIQAFGTDGVGFTLRPLSGGEIKVRLPVPGYFSVENGALAALCAFLIGIDAKSIKEALHSFAGVRGRMERICKGSATASIFLDYAHTPDALEKVLLSARGFAAPHQRILILFGCGGERDTGKRREMGRIASRLADFVILTSDNARGEDPNKILEQILRGVDKEKPHCVIRDRREAIAYALEEARPADILILAGKGHEEYEILGGKRLPFSEREIVREYLAKRSLNGEN